MGKPSIGTRELTFAGKEGDSVLVYCSGIVTLGDDRYVMVIPGKIDAWRD